MQLNDLYPPNSGDRELLSDVWAWRELLQRAIDGSESSDDASVSGLAEYEDLPGAWPPVTAGHQVQMTGRYLLLVHAHQTTICQEVQI